MQKLWLKKPRLIYSKDVFDIVQFGSSTEEEKTPNDLDIAVIFKKIPVKNQLEQAQKIKIQIEKTSSIPVHVNSFDLYSFFNASNFAKEGILFLGKSLISGDNFAATFGLSPRVQLHYSLEKLKKRDKIRFNYMLSGRGGKYGLLRKYRGELLKPGLIEVEPFFQKIFVDSIKEYGVEPKIKKILYG